MKKRKFIVLIIVILLGITLNVFATEDIENNLVNDLSDEEEITTNETTDEEVIETEEDDSNLKSLSIKGFSFYPSFRENIYNYSLTINEKVSQLEILAETENEDYTYEITGNDDLVEGENLIKVVVKDDDSEIKKEYEINAYIFSKNVQLQKTDKMPAIIMLLVLGIAIIGTGIAISKRKQ